MSPTVLVEVLHLHSVMVNHAVIDGSNLATEGRKTPSLAQLREAVAAFRALQPSTALTVVVDATFPNRIPRKERDEYEKAVDAGEMITPPAGAIGRGDAFILEIAARSGGVVVSNDSFQEFHGQYEWLLDSGGRLIGGKPVPHVGWIFVARAAVKGPTSRRSVQEAKAVKATVAKRAREGFPPAGPPDVRMAGTPVEPAATKDPAASVAAPAGPTKRVRSRRRTARSGLPAEPDAPTPDVTAPDGDVLPADVAAELEATAADPPTVAAPETTSRTRRSARVVRSGVERSEPGGRDRGRSDQSDRGRSDQGDRGRSEQNDRAGPTRTTAAASWRSWPTTCPAASSRARSTASRATAPTSRWATSSATYR